MSMLRNLWELREEDEAAVVAREFEQVGLADMEIEEEEFGWREVLRLHDSVHLFAMRETRRNGEEHVGYEAVIGGYGAGLPTVEGCRAWWSTELEADGYIHGHMCRRLLACDQYEEVVELLFHPEWTARMFSLYGIREIERDFGICLSRLAGRAEDDTLKALELLSVAVSMSSLFVTLNQKELWFQLHARLKGPAVMLRRLQEFVNRLELKAPTPWLRSLNDFMAIPNSANTRIISLVAALNCVAILSHDDRAVCGDSHGRIHIVNVPRSAKENEWIAHEGGVSAIAIARSGKRIVSVSEDRTAKVWDVDTLRCVAIFEGHYEKINCVAVVVDGKRVVTGSDDGTAHVWDMDTGQAVSKPFTGHEERVNCVALLDDGEHVLTGGSDCKVRLWNLSNRTQVRMAFQHENVQCLGLFPNGRRFASGSYMSINIWDIGTHAQIGESLEGVTYHGNCVCVSEDGKRIASATWDGRLCVWSVESRTPVSDPLEGHDWAITSLVFLTGRDSPVSCSEDGTLCLWDVSKANCGSCVDRLDSTENCLSFTPDGKRVVSGSYDMALRVWDATCGRQVGGPMKGHYGLVNDVALTHDGRQVVSVSLDNTIRLWNLQSEELVRTIAVHPDVAPPMCVAVTPSGDRVITGSSDGKVQVWDLRTTDSPAVLKCCCVPMPILRVLVSDDGLRMISVDFRGSMIVWDLDTRRRLKEIDMEGAMVTSRTGLLGLAGETTVDMDLSLPLMSRSIFYDDIRNRFLVLATVGESVTCWAHSPDMKTICVGLKDARLAFLKLET